MVVLAIVLVFVLTCLTLVVSMLRGGKLGTRWNLGDQSFVARDRMTRGDQP